MRALQIVFLALSFVSLIIAALTAGTNDGDTFWRAGIAILLFDVMLFLLWPTGALVALHRGLNLSPSLSGSEA